MLALLVPGVGMGGGAAAAGPTFGTFAKKHSEIKRRGSPHRPFTAALWFIISFLGG